MISQLTPSESLGQKFCAIFNYAWLAIAGTTETQKPNWETIGVRKDGTGKFPLKTRTLWAMWKDPHRLVGVRFDHTTSYGLLDVDNGSKFLNADGLNAICAALETIGIVRVIVIRSSHSGGVHIYFPLPEPVSTFQLAAAIKYTLEAQDIFLEPGQVEAFPNCKSYGRPWLNEHTQYNAHRLPLQNGSVILNSHDYQPAGAELATFLSRWEYAMQLQDMELLHEGLRHGRDQLRKHRKIKANTGTDWRSALELTISEGWTGPGQTNQLLKEIACYGRVFEKLEGYALVEFVERIAVTRPGYLEHCQHQAEIDKRAWAWARAAEKFYWPMGSKPHRTISTYDYNKEVSEGAIARIKSAVLQLATTGQLPEGIGQRARAIAQMAHTSMATLYKNLNLWQTDQWCVTAVTASDTGQSDTNTDPPCDRPKSSPHGLLHTIQKNMKGLAPEIPLLEFCNPASGEEEGGCKGEGKGFPQAEGALS